VIVVFFGLEVVSTAVIIVIVPRAVCVTEASEERIVIDCPAERPRPVPA
jgi:hypothetical protein